MSKSPESHFQSPPVVRFYTRRGCTLCDKIWPTVVRECDRLKLELQAVDIDSDPALKAAHGDWVPVVEIAGQVRLRGIIKPAWLKRELEQAASRPSQPTRMRVGVAVVYNDAGEMLVNRRPAGSYFGGWWEWPGGKCNPGESPLDATVRELREEMGVQARWWRLIERRRVEYPGRSIALYFYAARLVPGSMPSPDALEHRWLRPEDVRGLQFLEPNLPVLERLIADGPGLAG